MSDWHNIHCERCGVFIWMAPKDVSLCSYCEPGPSPLMRLQKFLSDRLPDGTFIISEDGKTLNALFKNNHVIFTWQPGQPISVVPGSGETFVDVLLSLTIEFLGQRP